MHQIACTFFEKNSGVTPRTPFLCCDLEPGPLPSNILSVRLLITKHFTPDLEGHKFETLVPVTVRAGAKA